MPDWQGSNRIDRIWQGAALASCLVHLCLVGGGWMWINSPVRLPKLSRAIQVSLAAPQPKKAAQLLPGKIAAAPIHISPPPVVERPPVVPQVQPVVAPPVKLPPPDKQAQQKTPVKPVLKSAPQLKVKPAVTSVVGKQPGPNFKPIPSPPIVVVTPPATIPQNAITALIPGSIVPAEPAGITEAEQAAIRDRYLALLRERIERHKNYPLMARKGRQQGVVLVEFELSGSGELQSSLVRESCGKRLLDRAALQAVEAAAPFPDIPPQILLAETSFVVPVRFVLGR